MKILVIGSGGREHALAWKLSQSKKVSQVFVASGNVGTAKENKIQNIALTQHADLIAFCQKENIAFTVVGPEAPLAAGIVNDFQAAGLQIFGPSKEAAQLESSKDFAKAFMARHNVPTAAYQTFSNADDAHEYLNQKTAPIVIKADGLAAGKGVVVAETMADAHSAVDMMLKDNKMGDAGARVVIEDFLQGEEASFIVMSDGVNVLPMATSQDHKRLLDGDKGLNTGGMGAYSPAPVVTDEVARRTMDEIILPTIRGMAAEGNPFVGFLYAGLMISPDGSPYTVEFNCRFGDPETQPIMLRLDCDLAELIEAALSGSLNSVSAKWKDETAIGVVLAAAGYPENVKKGDEISGIDAAEKTGAKVFYAGVANKDGKTVTNGGRVLCVTALGKDIQTAQQNSYTACEKIKFDGMQMRRDIGNKALKR